MSEHEMDIDVTTNKETSYHDEDRSGNDFEDHSDTSALMELAELACQSSSADASINFQQALPTPASVTIDSTNNSCASTVQKFDNCVVGVQLHKSSSPIQTPNQEEDMHINLSTSSSNEENKKVGQFVTFYEKKNDHLDKKVIEREQLFSQIPVVTCMNVEKSFDLPISSTDASYTSSKINLPKISNRRKSVSIFDNSDSCDSDESSIEDTLTSFQKEFIDKKNISNKIEFRSNDTEEIDLCLQNDEKITISNDLKNGCINTAEDKDLISIKDSSTVGVSDAGISVSEQFEVSKKLSEPDINKILLLNNQDLDVPTVKMVNEALSVDENLNPDKPTPSCEFENGEPLDPSKGKCINLTNKNLNNSNGSLDLNSSQDPSAEDESIHDKNIDSGSLSVVGNLFTIDRNKTKYAVEAVDLSKNKNLLNDQQKTGFSLEEMSFAHENKDKNIKSSNFYKDKLFEALCVTDEKGNMASEFVDDKNLEKCVVTNYSELSAGQCKIPLESGDVNSDSKDNFSSAALVQDSTLDLDVRRLSKSNVRENKQETNDNSIAKIFMQDHGREAKNDSADSIIENAGESNDENDAQSNAGKNTESNSVNNAKNAENVTENNIVNDGENDTGSNVVNTIESSTINDAESNSESNIVNEAENDTKINVGNDSESSTMNDAENDTKSSTMKDAESYAECDTESNIVNDTECNFKNNTECNIENAFESKIETASEDIQAVPECSEPKNNEANQEGKIPIVESDDVLKYCSGPINPSVQDLKLCNNLDSNLSENSVNEEAPTFKADTTTDSSMKAISKQMDKNLLADLAFEADNENTEVKRDNGTDVDCETYFEQINAKNCVDLTKDVLNTSVANTVQNNHTSVTSSFTCQTTLDNGKDTIDPKSEDAYGDKNVELAATKVPSNAKDDKVATDISLQISTRKLSGNSIDTPESITDKLHTCVEFSGASADAHYAMKTNSNTYKSITSIISSDTCKDSSHGEDIFDSCISDLDTNKDSLDDCTDKDLDTCRDTSDKKKYLTDLCKNDLISSKVILVTIHDTCENLKSSCTLPVKDSTKSFGTEDESDTKKGPSDSFMDVRHSNKEVFNVIKDSLEVTNGLHSCRDALDSSKEVSALNITGTINSASQASKCDSISSKYVTDSEKQGTNSSLKVIDSSKDSSNTCSIDASVLSVSISNTVKDISFITNDISNRDISDCSHGVLNRPTSVNNEDFSDNDKGLSDFCGGDDFNRIIDGSVTKDDASDFSKTVLHNTEGTLVPSTTKSNIINNTLEANFTCKDDSITIGDTPVTGNKVENGNQVDSEISKSTSVRTKDGSNTFEDISDGYVDACNGVSDVKKDLSDANTNATDVRKHISDASTDVRKDVLVISTNVTDVRKDVSNKSTDISGLCEGAKISTFNIGDVTDEVDNINKLETTRCKDSRIENSGEKNEKLNFCVESLTNKQNINIINEEQIGLCTGPIQQSVSLENSETVKIIENEKDDNSIYTESQESILNQQTSLPNPNVIKIDDLTVTTQSRKRTRTSSFDDNSIVKKVKFSEPLPGVDIEESDEESDFDDPNRLVIIESENELTHSSSKIIVPQDKSIAEKRDNQTAKINSDFALDAMQHVDSNDNMKMKTHSPIKDYVKEAQTTDTPSGSTSRIDDDDASDIEVIEVINDADRLNAKYSVEGICEKCCETWNSKTLKLLFEGNESVTIKSKITYGAIICMNNYAKLRYKYKEEIAVRKLLNRAGLGLSKNLSSIKISELSHQILERIKNGKMSCCDVFYLLYLVKKGSANAVNKNSKLKIDDFINIDDDDEPSSKDRLAKSSSTLSPSVSTPVVNITSNVEVISSKMSSKIIEGKISSSDQADASQSSVSKTKSLTNWEITSKPYSKKTENLKNIIIAERKNLSSDVVEFYDQLPCQVATSEEEIIALKHNKLKNIDVLNIFFLFNNDVKLGCNTFFKLLFQIAFLRGRILLIPDGSTLVEVVDNLANSKVISNDLNFEFDEWDSEHLYSTPIYGFAITKYPSIREILSLFCSWNSKTLLSCQQYKQFDLKDALFKLFKEKINLNDSCGLCVRLYTRYCTLLFQQKEPAKANLYLSLFYLPKKEQSALKKATVIPHDISILPPSNQNISKHIQYLKESKSLPSKLKRKLPESIINYKLIQTKKMKAEILSQVKDEKIQGLLNTYSHIHPDLNKNEAPVTVADTRQIAKLNQSRAMINKMYSVLKADNVPNEKIEFVISKVLSIIR